MEAGGIEFFTDGANELWMRYAGGDTRKFLQGEVETVERLAAAINKVYPKVYETLDRLYSKSRGNRMAHQYKIVARFVRCNMGADDMGKFDIEGDKLNLEQTRCPLKGSGDCPLENIVCNPRATGLTEKEREVVVLYARGFSLGKIADILCKTKATVNHHLQNVRKRFGLERTRDIVMLAYLLNLI